MYRAAGPNWHPRKMPPWKNARNELVMRRPLNSVVFHLVQIGINRFIVSWKLVCVAAIVEQTDLPYVHISLAVEAL
jgi:hypothetical protein